jgi:apolipoprotein N-acyltransferase
MKKVRRVGVLSVTKMYAAVYGVLGLVFALVFIFASLVGYLLASDKSYPGYVAAGIIVAMPLIYGILGLVSGFLIARIYNMVAKFLGGIEVELQDEVAVEVKPVEQTTI